MTNHNQKTMNRRSCVFTMTRSIKKSVYVEQTASLQFDLRVCTAHCHNMLAKPLIVKCIEVDRLNVRVIINLEWGNHTVCPRSNMGSGLIGLDCLGLDGKVLK